MLSRTRILAAVTLLAGCLAAPAAWAQATNLEAGKSASQLFAGTCNACHKSPHGLLKSVSAGSLPGFLREHYTTSSDMASQLSSYLISNGASDPRSAKQGVDQAKQGADKDKQGGADQVDRQGRKMRNAPSQEAARPDADAPAGENGRQKKRLAHPGEPPEEAKPLANAPAAVERGPDGRRLSAKQRLNRPGRPGAEEPPVAKDEPPKAEPDDTAKGEAKEETGNAERGRPAAEGKSNEAKSSDVKPADVKPADVRPSDVKPAEAKPAEAKPTDAKSTEPKSTEAKSDSGKTEAPKDGPGGDKAIVRRDPAPPVTPAPPAASTAAPAVASGASPEPAAARPMAPASPEPPSVTASAPPPPPPAGPPAPPISK
jgi:hypothetical protein